MTRFTRWFYTPRKERLLSETSPGIAKFMRYQALQNCERNKRVAEFVASELVRIRKGKRR